MKNTRSRNSSSQDLLFPLSYVREEINTFKCRWDRNPASLKYYFSRPNWLNWVKLSGNKSSTTPVNDTNRTGKVTGRMTNPTQRETKTRWFYIFKTGIWTPTPTTAFARRRRSSPTTSCPSSCRPPSSRWGHSWTWLWSTFTGTWTRFWPPRTTSTVSEIRWSLGKSI